MQRRKMRWFASIAVLATVFLATYLVYLSVSPSPKVGPVDKKIVLEIQKRCLQRSPCTVCFADVTNDFNWDTMYVFEMGANRAEIESVIHTPFNHSPDLVKTLIFMKQGRITHYEEEQEDFENATDQSLNFNIEQSGAHQQFLKDAVFSVSIKKYNTAVVYTLTATP